MIAMIPTISPITHSAPPPARSSLGCDKCALAKTLDLMEQVTRSFCNNRACANIVR